MVIYGVASYIILKRNMQSAVCVEGNIYEAGNIKSPFVLGIFHARIYLPVGLDENAREYILLHEQTHIKRCDHIIKLIAYFILCLHWFNPLAWVAFLLMSIDMEMSCDERVLKEIGGETKKDYSMSLLSLATERRFVQGSPLAFGEGDVKQRIKNVLNFRKPSRIIVVTAVVLAFALSIGFAVNRPVDNPTYLEIASLISASQEEVHQKIGFPQETFNGVNIFIINGKRISITYDENNHVNHINYNGEVVVNAPDTNNIVKEAELSTEPFLPAGHGNDTVDLSLGNLEVNAEELVGYRLYTNSTRISVSIPRGDYEGTIYLYDTQNLTDHIMQFELNQTTRSRTFTNLTSANIYLIRADGLDGCKITISD